MKPLTKEPLYTKGGIKVYAYDPVDYLDSDDAIAGCFAASLEEYDPEFFLDTIGIILRAKGLNTAESIVKIAQYMLPPKDTAEIPRGATRPVAKKSTRKNTARKTSAKKNTAPRHVRKKREAAMA